VAAPRDEIWSQQMRAAIAGDEAAYRTVLRNIAPAIRATARAGFARYGSPAGDVEDVVQETLLAVHLKRHTWQQSEPLMPWVLAIARNKLIDCLRRKRGIDVPIDDVVETLEAATEEQPLDGQEVTAMLDSLQPRQRDIVRMITLEGHAIKDVAGRLAMNEGAVRVALHRSLKAMAAYYRSNLA
jgi:RNA polymerase sigma-70 factor (ECF subfamily)